MPISTVTNEDCMIMMSRYPDKFFELAIVDPPYGLGERLATSGNSKMCKGMRNLNDGKVTLWDSAIPDRIYFDELFRVSKNQIIWGANYFFNYLWSNDGIIIWDKMNGTNPLSDAEIAWKSLPKTTRIFRMHHFSSGYGEKIHPTQKPVQLYKWLLTNYAKPGDKILDTHLGSGSSRIAAYNMGFDFYGCELDPDYFKASEKRFKEQTMQQSIFI